MILFLLQNLIIINSISTNRKLLYLIFDFNILNFYIIVVLILVLLFFLLNFLLSYSLIFNYKLLPFECGFDYIGFNQSSLSIHFVFIILIFVIFDLELILFLGFLLFNFIFFYYFILYFFLSIASFYME